MQRLKDIAAAVRDGMPRPRPRFVVAALVAGALAFSLYQDPPVRTVPRGDVGLRENLFTGEVTQWRDGSVLVMPGVHRLHVYSVRDRVYHPAQMASAAGPQPLQSQEGLSLGLDMTVRYALDPARLAEVAGRLPEDIDGEVVEPAIRGVAYKILAAHTVREIFSTQRAEIQKSIESELRARLVADGVILRDVLLGKVDLPADYRRGMDALLAEELASDKMRFTLELKDKRVKEAALEAEAEKVRREKTAEAAAREQVIAARAQEDAMKHVLPWKQRQVEQRKLEAEAEKQARIRSAEGSAQARQIEATGEASARQKLADAEAYRLDKVGRASADQMAREGAVVTQHPLLVQKTLADKLSDKVQVIVAPPSTDGRLLSALIGQKAER
jgi:regulator of protease activity HflC (stomatin/prohibitin superfamily)